MSARRSAHTVPWLFAVLVAAGLFLHSRQLSGQSPLVTSGSAFVSSDAGGWVIGNEYIRYSLGRQGSAVVVRAIEDTVSGLNWRRAATPDSFVTVNGKRVDIGSSATVFQGATAVEWWGGVKLDLKYKVSSASLDVTRSYVCYPGGPVIETWTTFQAAGNPSVALSDLTNFALTIGNGTVRWIDGADVSDDREPFTLGAQDLADGQTFDIGSDRRASERTMPWFAVSAWTSDVEQTQPARVRNATQFFGSMLWSGSWSARIRRAGGNAAVQLGLPSFVTTLGAGGTLEGPHAIFGTTNEVLPSTSTAIVSFVDQRLRRGRPLRALVTYNTWYPYGTFLDEASMRAEMALAAEMGFEQFVIDAGWWAGANPRDRSDYVHGWGNWKIDRRRFPSGLGALTDYAHELGLRFGVWVEPERVDRATVGRPGLAQERFLATEGGRYDPSAVNGHAVSGQICLADPEARQWLLTKLHAFIDEVRPDYLKWDNNFWLNCDRPDHGHGTTDGNFRHILGLNEVLADLRASYPDMDIENCATGAHRLSLDTLAFTDAAWVDDRSEPSGRVRHNLGGLSALFPPAYLFTFAMAGDNEPLADDQPDSDVSSIMRSRMSGVLGGAWTTASLDGATRYRIADQIALYKRVRPILQESGSILLGRQATALPQAMWPGWDAVQHLSPRSRESVVFAFRTAEGPEDAVIKVRGLLPDALYDVESADHGSIGTATGADLMDRGIPVDASGGSRSYVLTFRLSAH
jgi:alpha-galactosidase